MSYHEVKRWMNNVKEFPMEKTNYRNCKIKKIGEGSEKGLTCLLYTSPSPRD